MVLATSTKRNNDGRECVVGLRIQSDFVLRIQFSTYKCLTFPQSPFFSLHADANDPVSCQKLVSTLNSLEDLPSVCQNYSSVVESMKKNTSSVSAEDIAFHGMRPGQAIQARRSRASGIEHQAKLNRRMTSSGKGYHYMPQKTAVN